MTLRDLLGRVEPDTLRAAVEARYDRLIDSAYVAGMKAGWNYCVAEDDKGYAASAARTIGHRARIEHADAALLAAMVEREGSSRSLPSRTAQEPPTNHQHSTGEE